MSCRRVSIGSDVAIELAKSKWWEHCTDRHIVGFQIFVSELCLPFGVFHEALERVLGRSVYTHEFAINYGGLIDEFLGIADPPSTAKMFQAFIEKL